MAVNKMYDAEIEMRYLKQSLNTSDNVHCWCDITFTVV